MKKRIFKILDSANTFFIYASTISTLVTLIIYALSYNNDFSYTIKCVWSWLFNLSVFFLSGSVGYRNMPKFFDKSTKLGNLIFVILCYMIAIVFLIFSVISFFNIFFG